MKIPRRRFLSLAVGAVALPAVSRIATAQAYPSRPVRITVGYPPGGITDIYARLMGQGLSERLGQPFIIENRAGAGGSIAVDSVVRALPDGYTLLLTGANDVFDPTLYPDLKYNYVRDIVPIAGIAFTAQVMVVHPALPATTVPEFIRYAKATPGRINYASAGVGTGQHLCGEFFKILTGVDMVHVPYRGAAPALADLIAGQVQLMFDFLPSSIEHIRAGKLRALAVGSPKRWQGFPDLPTVGDFLPGFEAGASSGIAAPKNTPDEVIDRLNREINATLADPRMKARIAELGGETLTGSPTQFANLLIAEAEKWRFGRPISKWGDMESESCDNDDADPPSANRVLTSLLLGLSNPVPLGHGWPT
jgi:tripartite-type tricarboxylate transporter receptor subunit TctC